MGARIQNEEAFPKGQAFRDQLARVAADRHSPEAAALYKVLFDFTKNRVRRLASRARLSSAEQEEVVGDVLLMLMRGSLASFRGGSLPELLGFVRTITDRAAWKVVRRRDKEREAMESADLDDMRSWTGAPPGPVDAVEMDVDSPLPEKDRDYLRQLLRAGTKANLARKVGVSRAAVTQRVRRIVDKVKAMEPAHRLAHEAWLEREARVAAALEE